MSVTAFARAMQLLLQETGLPVYAGDSLPPGAQLPCLRWTGALPVGRAPCEMQVHCLYENDSAECMHMLQLLQTLLPPQGCLLDLGCGYALVCAAGAGTSRSGGGLMQGTVYVQVRLLPCGD